MELVEWLKIYLCWKDKIEKTIKEIKETGNTLEVFYENKKETFLTFNQLKEVKLDSLSEIKGICAENTEENLLFLIKHWKDFSNYPKLQLIFVNLALGEKWIIFPATHAKIADKDTLECGLRSMFDLANGNVREVKQKKQKQKMFEDVEDSEEIEE